MVYARGFDGLEYKDEILSRIFRTGSHEICAI